MEQRLIFGVVGMRAQVSDGAGGVQAGFALRNVAHDFCTSHPASSARSDASLQEGILYACTKHQEILATGERESCGACSVVKTHRCWACCFVAPSPHNSVLAGLLSLTKCLAFPWVPSNPLSSLMHKPHSSTRRGLLHWRWGGRGQGPPNRRGHNRFCRAGQEEPRVAVDQLRPAPGCAGMCVCARVCMCVLARVCVRLSVRLVCHAQLHSSCRARRSPGMPHVCGRSNQASQPGEGSAPRHGSPQALGLPPQPHCGTTTPHVHHLLSSPPLDSPHSQYPHLFPHHLFPHQRDLRDLGCHIPGWLWKGGGEGMGMCMCMRVLVRVCVCAHAHVRMYVGTWVVLHAAAAGLFTST